MSDLHEKLLKIGVTTGGGPDEETGDIRQCYSCRWYLRLAGRAGADWGVCGAATWDLDDDDKHVPGTSENAGRLVFEHAGCPAWEYGDAPERPEPYEPDGLRLRSGETGNETFDRELAEATR